MTKDEALAYADNPYISDSTLDAVIEALAARVRELEGRTCDRCEHFGRCTIEVMLLKLKATRQACGAFKEKTRG